MFCLAGGLGLKLKRTTGEHVDKHTLECTNAGYLVFYTSLQHTGSGWEAVVKDRSQPVSEDLPALPSGHRLIPPG